METRKSIAGKETGRSSPDLLRNHPHAGMRHRSGHGSPISPDFTHIERRGIQGRAGTDLVSAWRRAAPWPPCFLAGVQQENRDEGLRARGGCGYGKEVEERVSPAGGRWKSSTQRPRSVVDFLGMETVWAKAGPCGRA
jgi:hypothetical protein